MRIAAALVIWLIAAVAQAQSPAREAFITVAGEGHVNVPPEYAEFFAEVSTRGESLEAAMRQHTERAGRAAAALRALANKGVSVERSSFRLEQSRALRPAAGQQKQAPPEYRAITTFTVQADKIDTLNETVSAIGAAGLFEIRNIRYGIKNEEKAVDDARRAAVKSARRQAEVYADAAGVKLGDILEIFDGVAQNLGSEAALRAATPNVQLSPPATIPFRATINMKWRILPQQP